jgi:site-specific recombinase XerD
MAKPTVEEFLSHIEQSKSVHTLRLYRRGLELFSEYSGKGINEILQMRLEDWTSGDMLRKKRFRNEIERFSKWMITKGYLANSARSYVLGILELFAYYEMPISDVPKDLTKVIQSTKSFVPTIQQLRVMFKVADNTRDKLVVSMAKDLAWRISDFVQIRKDQLPDLNQESPISFDLISGKELVLAKSFLSGETVELLKEYLVIVQANPNPFLFPSNGEGHRDPDSINKTLQLLAQRAKIVVPKNKRLSFHSFRKRFLSTCADLHIDVNTAKLLCGKDVEASMLAYLSEVDHRSAFIKVSEFLSLSEKPKQAQIQNASELELRLEKMERVLAAVVALGGADILQKARKVVETSEVGKMSLKTGKPLSDIEILELYGKTLEEAQRKEYQKLLAEENGNGNGS